MDKKLTALIIMDGFGIPQDYERSGITLDNTKNLEEYKKKFLYTTLHASEEYVGLPKYQAGTSEVGHMTIGSGRTTYQPLVRINREIKSGKFYENKTLNEAIDYAKKNNKKVHLLGLTSDGGIHSHIDHLFALLDLLKLRDYKNAFIHFISDGRDTSPKCAKKYLDMVSSYTKKIKLGKISTIIGRFYALDRDKNWTRNEEAYNLWVYGKGERFENYDEAIESAYKRNETDEFLTPIVLTQNGVFDGNIEEGDVVISYNFRTDRERQLAYVLAEDNDLPFTKDLKLYFVTMTEYDENFSRVHVAYKNEEAKEILSEVLSKNNVRQVKIAETEKYAHLTFFFNSGRQEAFPLEDRVLINSKKMQSYASCPEMSAKKITQRAIEEMDSHDFIAINFANCDMVGHSGNKGATRIATQVVDECVKKVVDEVLRRGGQGIITADHGNADIMEYEDGTPNTAHTTSLVPLIIFGVGKKEIRSGGALCDIAPTILSMMKIDIPKSMTGKVLIK